MKIEIPTVGAAEVDHSSHSWAPLTTSNDQKSTTQQRKIASKQVLNADILYLNEVL